MNKTRRNTVKIKRKSSANGFEDFKESKPCVDAEEYFIMIICKNQNTLQDIKCLCDNPYYD